MANQSDFLNGYRTLANCQYDGSEQSAIAKQIVDEMKWTSIMNDEASVMEASGLFEHKAFRDNELDNGAEFVAYEEGFARSGFTHNEEFSVQMGRIVESKSYRNNQTRYDKEAEANRIARDLKKVADAINRKDARALVYGGVSDLKSYNGLASFTDTCYDINEVYRAIEHDKLPFKNANSCITLDATKFDYENAVNPTSGFAGSIFAVVWGSDYVSKLYPHADTVSYGINMNVHLGEKFEYTDSITGVTRHGFEDIYDFEKFTGLWVGNRWGLIRIANINCNPAQTAKEWEAQLKRVEEAASHAMRLFDYAGLANRASWYTNGTLVQKFKQLRADKQVYVAGVSAQGQPQNMAMQTPFMLLDSVPLKHELTMTQFERTV